MRDIIFTLIFSIVLLFFAIYPAIKIVEMIGKNINITQKWQNILSICLTVALALVGGIFLRYY